MLSLLDLSLTTRLVTSLLGVDWGWRNYIHPQHPEHRLLVVGVQVRFFVFSGTFRTEVKYRVDNSVEGPTAAEFVSLNR